MSVAYAIICVTCEDAALFRTSYSLPALFTRYAAVRREQHLTHLVDTNGFECCQSDRLLLTLCWNCERLRGAQYDLNATTNVPANHYHSRLTNPNLSKEMIRQWPVIRAVQDEFMPNKILLGPSDAARPILKIELLSRMLNYGNDTSYEYVGTRDGRSGRRHEQKQRFFVSQRSEMI